MGSPSKLGVGLEPTLVEDESADEADEGQVGNDSRPRKCQFHQEGDEASDHDVGHHREDDSVPQLGQLLFLLHGVELLIENGVRLNADRNQRRDDEHADVPPVLGIKAPRMTIHVPQGVASEEDEARQADGVAILEAVPPWAVDATFRPVHQRIDCTKVDGQNDESQQDRAPVPEEREPTELVRNGHRVSNLIEGRGNLIQVKHIIPYFYIIYNT